MVSIFMWLLAAAGLGMLFHQHWAYTLSSVLGGISMLVGALIVLYFTLGGVGWILLKIVEIVPTPVKVHFNKILFVSYITFMLTCLVAYMLDAGLL